MDAFFVDRVMPTRHLFFYECPVVSPFSCVVRSLRPCLPSCSVAHASTVKHRRDAGDRGGDGAGAGQKRGAWVIIPTHGLKAAEDMHARIRAECPTADILVLPLDRAFADRFLELGLPLRFTSTSRVLGGTASGLPSSPSRYYYTAWPSTTA
ncbi:hypothetical protein EJB05_02726, partial [Eragrostis curvula]